VPEKPLIDTRESFSRELNRVAPDTILAECADFWFSTHDGTLRHLAARRVPAAQVKELVQVVWLDVFQHLDDFRGAGAEGQRMWLVRRVRDRAADHFRKLRHRHEVPLAEAGGYAEPVAEDHEPAEEFALHWKCAAIRAVVDEVSPQLSATTAAVLRLRHFEQLSDAEIAEKLGLTEHQVRDRDYQARKKLKRRLEQLYGPGAERL
jgi:RNA polymerase sigma factor (sigma-70 family)